MPTGLGGLLNTAPPRFDSAAQRAHAPASHRARPSPPSRTHAHTHTATFATRRRAMAPCHNPLLSLGGSARTRLQHRPWALWAGRGLGAAAQCRHARARALFVLPTARAPPPPCPYRRSGAATSRGGAKRHRPSHAYSVEGALRAAPASLPIAYAARATAWGTAHSALAVRSRAWGGQPRRAIARPIDRAARQPVSP